MFLVRRPDDATIRQFVLEQAALSFSYDEVGMTRGAAPVGFAANHHRVELGRGPKVFEAACREVRRWTMFKLGWVRLCYDDAAIRPGTTVGILVRRLGLWSLNACRIVEVIDASGPTRQFGFRYGTLPEHAELGEERFLIEWDPADDRVSYDILAYSRPNHWITRAFRPITRRFQKQFARQSLEAMRMAVQAAT